MTFPGIILAVSLLFSSPEAAKDVDIPHPGPHPRILLREKGEEGIRNAIGSRKVFAQADSVIVHYCDSILGEPPLERVMTGRRMLSVSREALRRIFYLSYSFRVHEDRRYLERAIEEMLKVSGFSSWNPSHFLDTGEMTMALAIGYDWLFYEMTPSQRETVSKAMLEKGFLPSKDEEGCAWFYSSPLNWNQVCNAGLTYGAIALWDDYPAESERIVRRCLESNPLSMKSYSPEGGYEEGYGYWGYGSTFEIMLISALESAFGSDLGLVDSEGGFLRSGRFIQMMTTPSGGCFNYGDCSPEASVQYALGWMAKRIHDPSLLYNELRIVERKGFDSIIEPRLFPLFLIYGSALDLNAVTPPEGNFYQCSGGAPLFIYREGWEDEGDAYLGIKAGMASSSHGHVDVSSFIFEEEGVRWAADIGGEDYQRIEGSGVDLWDNKQYSPRWRIFRLGPICHNILTVNGQIPDVDVSLDFSRSWKCPVKKGVEIYTSLLYMNDLKECVRQVYLDGENTLFTRDSIATLKDRGASISWHMCSCAEASLTPDGKIILSKDGKTRILSSSEGIPFIRDAKGPNPYDSPNYGYAIVGFTLEVEPDKECILEVRLEKPR